jgi:hypothetical protein
MTKYLVVAHQTASSPELLDKLKELAREDAEAEFVLLVPATPVRHLLASVEGEARAAAQSAAEAAKTLSRQTGYRSAEPPSATKLPSRQFRKIFARTLPATMQSS